MDDPELFNNLPEDEYDALNDETFGNDDGVEYKWEESQNLFGDLNDTSNGAKDDLRQNEETFDNGAGGDYGDFGLDVERTRDLEYDEFENENSLEESISRLVMDEFDEDDDEMPSDRLRRIAAGKSNYPFFMPPQVVNRHLQWFMDKELPGGSSLLGSSVWSMHPTSIATATAPTSAPVRTVVSATTATVISNNDPTLMYNSPYGLHHNQGQHGLDLSTGTDLSNLLGVSNAQKPAILPTGVPPGLPPTFKTVDEIEEEMLREAERKKGIENKDQSEETVRHGIMSVEKLERKLIHGSSSTAQVTPTPSQLAGILGTVPGQLDQQQFDPTKVQPNRPSAQQQQQQQQQPIRLPNNNINQSASNIAFLRQQQQQQQQQGVPFRNILPQPPRPLYPHPNNFNNMMASQGISRQALLQLQQHQQQQLRFLQMNSHPASHVQAFRMGFPIPSHNLRNNMQFPLGVARMHQQNIMQPRRPEVKTDRSSCLMTEKDKQRLRNIQIVQLQNDHPYITDYYCLMRRVKIAGPANPQKEILRMLFPKKSDDENGNKKLYEPAHFENSLGKLQAQSALAPKKAIDTVIRVTETAPTSGRKSYRYLLMEIEKLYEAVLAIEEGDIRASLATGGGESDELERKKLREKMERVLLNPQKLAEIMVVKKGRFLICRCAPLMQENVRASAVLFLIKTFPSWTRLNGESMDLYNYIRYCILNMDVSGFERLCLGLSETVLQSMVASKLGMSLIMGILHQGEKLILKPSIDEQFKTLWTRCVYLIWMTILQNKSSLAQPVEVYNIYMHRQLLGDVHQISPQLKDEMRILLSMFLSKGTHLNKMED